MPTTVEGIVVTRSDPPLTLDIPLVSESTPVVGEDINPPDWDTTQIGTEDPVLQPGSVQIFLDTVPARTRCWAGWWVAQLLRVASPRAPWPDPGYRFFRVSFTWPSGAAVVQTPEPDPTGFNYVNAYGPSVIAELDASDLEALAA